ncbi:MAG: hypothetical protein AAGC92_15020 [Pseudomonadota bacterium]
MGIHLFVIRSWYFMALAIIGTLHVTIPLAIATYYVVIENEPLTTLLFIPVFYVTIAYLNVNAMRAVIRSYGLTGEPDFINTVKSVFRHMILDTLMPLAISFVISAIFAFAAFYLVDPAFLLLGVFNPMQVDELSSMISLAQSTLPVKLSVIINIFVVLPYIYPFILCIFGVSIASGAASASANPPGHLPIHAVGAKFWHILATILVNFTLVGLLLSATAVGTAISDLSGSSVLPAIGIGFIGLVLIMGYFNTYVVFALAYCAHEEQARAERVLIGDLRRYGMQDEGLDVRALRHGRMGGGSTSAAE